MCARACACVCVCVCVCECVCVCVCTRACYMYPCGITREIQNRVLYISTYARTHMFILAVTPGE